MKEEAFDKWLKEALNKDKEISEPEQSPPISKWPPRQVVIRWVILAFFTLLALLVAVYTGIYLWLSDALVDIFQTIMDWWKQLL